MRTIQSQKSRGKAAGVATRLRLLVERCGGVNRLAEKARIPSSTVSRYLAGGSAPQLASSAALAHAGEVSLDWLASGRGSPDAPGSDIEESVPFYDLQASAGPGLIAPDHDPAAQRISLPISQIRRQTGVTSADLLAMLASGDSMETTILSGALLLLDRSIQNPREGIHVIQRGDDVLVKRVQPRGARSVLLISDNKRYAPEEVSLADPTVPVRFLGQVIWVGQHL